MTAPDTDDDPLVVVVGNVELANEAVVADVTVNAQGAWAPVLIEGNDAEDELELDGTVRVGAGDGLGIELVGAAEDPVNGEGGAAAVVGAAAPGGAV